jgi:hypothetical protein
MCKKCHVSDVVQQQSGSEIKDIQPHFKRCHTSDDVQQQTVGEGIDDIQQTGGDNGEGGGCCEPDNEGNVDSTEGRGGCEAKIFHCHKCPVVCENKKILYEHYMLNHRQVGGQLQNRPWQTEQDAPWYENGVVDKQLEHIYNMHASLILQNHHVDKLISTYNFPVDNSLDIDTMMKHLEYIYSQETKVFKINISFGFILQNIETNEYRAFKAYSNNNVFEIPVVISKREDLEKLKQKMINMDLLQFISYQRPNTKFRLKLVTNIVYTIFSQLEYTLGNSKRKIPSFIKQKKFIVTLDRDTKGVIYNDNLCFFRCLTYHFHRHLYKHPSTFESKVHEYFVQYNEYFENEKILFKKDFKGVDLSNVCYLESCFSVNINIFKLHSDLSCSAVYKSLMRYDDVLNVNLYENHISYISDFQNYVKKFQCSFCFKMINRKDNWRRHENSCETKRTLVFVGGFHKSNFNIFEQLEYFGINVDIEKRFFKYFIVYDMESILKPLKDESTEKIIWTHEHQPISVSICSNYEGFRKPHCIVNPDMHILVKEMIDYIKSVVQAIQIEKIACFEEHFQQLEDLICDWERKNGNESILLGKKIMLTQLNNIKESFEKYCLEIPVVGFNSGRYDINLIKVKILEYLEMEKIKNPFIVKKNNCYSCISNGELKFIDVMNFLSPGTSYSRFLKAFDVTETKGFFPYEYFTDVSKLSEKSLPPLGQAWWSTLKGKCLLDDGVHSIQENYKWLQKVWEEEGMNCFEDFLRWYNNLDVGPFVEALVRLSTFYFEKGVDLFKDVISLPGVSRKMVFEIGRQAGASFSLIDKKNEDLYHLINDNIVGGPSIVFNRFHKKGETFIRSNDNFPCRKICGWDANALYLWALGQKMPAGDFIRRKLEDGFYPIKREKYESMFHWMDWLNYTEGLNIMHYRNSGFEKRVGAFLIDGFDSHTNTLFQFHGCYYHGHGCCLLSHKKKTDKERRQLLSRQKRTKLTTSYLKSEGYTVVEIYECEFKEMKYGDRELREFIAEKYSSFTKKRPRKVKEEEIIQGVLSEELYGMLEVDIYVPDSWDEVLYRPDTDLIPYEYYREMCPLFGNVEVTFDSIGKSMQEYVNKFNLSKQPRHLLIGAMKAEKMLIATPLLKWYLLHGLKVTKIYQVIEYNNPSFAFRSFVKSVTESRRQGDVDPSKSILADSMKLVGNAAFGSMIMNKAKHKKTYYVKGIENGSNAVNDKLFERITEIGDEYYEVESFKSKINLDLPTQIGFFILQLAKMRMLQFYYDFMDKFVERCNFEYCQMDTDSAYIALSGESLDDIIKPNMKKEYFVGLKGLCKDDLVECDIQWFPRKCCQRHSRFDKRTPGLFKVEFEGDEMISLCSKTYVISSDERQKFSSKGVNKGQIKDPLNIYRDVLHDVESGSGINMGFRLHDGKICTYNQEKQAFSYFYCKRKVLADGIHTEPLDITLTPKKNNLK